MSILKQESIDKKPEGPTQYPQRLCPKKEIRKIQFSFLKERKKEKFRPTSRRSRQRCFQKAQRKEEEVHKKEERREELDISNKETLILKKIKSTIFKSYGFIADPSLTSAHNASIILNKMPSWYYFSRPLYLALHDLTIPTTDLPKCLPSVIGLGIKFCLVTNTINRRQIKTFNQFRKDLYTKVYFSGRP